MSDSRTVLISYSHDSREHEARVLELSDRLRSDGIDAIIDQYEPFPPQGWIRWMNGQIERAHFVLVVCTETYRRRATGEELPGIGLGVTHEAALIQQLIYNASGVNDKFIPVVFNEEGRAHIPLELQRYTNYVLYDAYKDLCHLLTGRSGAKKKSLPPRQAQPDFRNAVWKVPSRNPYFTGRETYLQKIRETMKQSNVAALSGIGGIGKTHTAIEYAHLHRGDYQAVLWTSADENVSLTAGFCALAHTLGLPEKDQKEQSAVVAGVTRWLESHSGWLLLLDNIDTIEDLNIAAKLIPSNGHLLITTRLQNCGRIAKAVELTKMDPHEGARFLLRRTGIIGQEREAEQICREVDGLPLALDQASAFIEETPSTLAEYLTLYQTEGARLRKLRGDVAPEHPSVAVTFSLAFSRLSSKNPAAADLVKACAFLAPDTIPEELFTQAGKELGESLAQLVANPLDFAAALRDAGRFALIRRNATSKTLDMHRQVQEVIKDEMNSDNHRLWAERVVAALAHVFPFPEFWNWAQCEVLVPHARVAARQIAHLDLNSPSAAHLLNETAYYLSERAEYKEAEQLYKRALAIREKVLGPDHPDTATCINNLAKLYRNWGDFQQAEPLFRRALAIREIALGADHSGTAACLNNLAVLYHDQGRYKQAEPLFRRALAIRKKALGRYHPQTAACLNNLARLYSDIRRPRRAEPLYKRAAVIYEKTLGPDHPKTAATVNNLAALYLDHGLHQHAEELLLRALSICEKALAGC